MYWKIGCLQRHHVHVKLSCEYHAGMRWTDGLNVSKYSVCHRYSPDVINLLMTDSIFRNVESLGSPQNHTNSQKSDTWYDCRHPWRSVSTMNSLKPHRINRLPCTFPAFWGILRLVQFGVLPARTVILRASLAAMVSTLLMMSDRASPRARRYFDSQRRQ